MLEGIKKLIALTGEIIYDGIANVIDFLGNNLRNIARILEISLPFYMYYAGINSNGDYHIEDISFAIIIILLNAYFRTLANKIGKGITIPIPDKRFTEVNDGEASIENDRVQELILYLADLEDWMERKGLLK